MAARATAIPEIDTVLEGFHPAVAAWVREQFDAPTEVQLRGWEAIARGAHALLGAPTGSGKTLAAFLAGIDRLVRSPLPDADARLRMLYVSPLRALNYDIERNLRAPLQGIARHAAQLGLDVPQLTVGVRTGDTPQSERQRQRRTPPDIFITTPESLYVMLTSGARELFDHVETVIIDEIHALASNKRGTHLAFTLERLTDRVRAASDRDVQRIGLSATQRPIERIADFLGGAGRSVEVIDTPGAKEHDLQVVVPVEDMTAVGSRIVATELSDLDTPTSNNDSYSIWGALHEELLDHVEAHTSTIVFVNSRRLSERLAGALNELASRRAINRHVAAERARYEAEGLPWSEDTELEIPAGIGEQTVARAHHGSISRDARTEMEELLKSGRLPCIVATSSLELGIDMGAVDLVLLVESPRSVASGLQRIGRAGHNVGDVSRGRIYPKHRADLVEAAAVTRLMARREIEPVHVPELCLDVLAQQIVATCAERPYAVTELHDLARRAYPWRELSREQLENLLSLLAGYFPIDEVADIKARVTWDRSTDLVETRSDAARIAITNAGTIPDRGLYGVYVVGADASGMRGRVGELDEEMVHETRLGDVIVLGSTSWRVEEITRDRVNVSPQPGAIGKPPFWHGEGLGRTVTLGRAVGSLVRTIAEGSPDAADADDPTLATLVDDAGADAALLATIMDEYHCERRAARNLVAFVREQIAATGAAPDDRTIVVERFRDELGDWRICILTPYGKPVHAPWAMAIEEHLNAQYGIEVTALWSDDGIALRLPDLETLPPVEALLPAPDDVEELVVAQVGASALFASRFREVATRSLVLPLSSFRRRSPLWMQRIRAADVQRVAQQQASFPMILETYREVLRDVFSMPDLRDLLQRVQQRSVRVVEVETATASPMSASLLFDYTASLLYAGDQPAAERRAQALSLDQGLLRELLGTGDLRELLDADAIAEVHAELQRTDPKRHARTMDQVHDLLRSLGDLTEAELAERVAEQERAQLPAWLAELAAGKRAVAIRLGDEQRWISIEDTADYVDVLGVQAPRGVPGVFLEPSADPLGRLVGRRMRTVTPVTAAQLAARWGVAAAGVDAALQQLAASGSVLHGGFLPGGIEEEWCDAEVLRRLRRRTLAHLRREIEPADRTALARFLTAWHGLVQPPAGSPAAALDVVMQLEGIEASPQQWERDLVAPRLASWRAAWLDELVRTGQLTWMGRGTKHGSLQVALYATEHVELLAPERDPLPEDNPDCQVIADWLERGGASFLGDIVAGTGIPHERALTALWQLAAAGWTTNDSWSTVRAGATAPARTSAAQRQQDGPEGIDAVPGTPTAGVRRRRGRRAGSRAAIRGNGRRAVGALERDVRFQGRWSLLPAARASEDERITALSEALLDTFGVVTRHAVHARPVPGGFAAVYRALAVQEEIGAVRRGWFVEGLGGGQFALPEAVDRLRAVRERTGGQPPTIVLRANDPAQPYGAILDWPEHPAGVSVTPRRDSTSYVVLRDGELLATIGPSSRRLVLWQREELPHVARALARVVLDRRLDRLAIELVDDGPVDADVLTAFADTGFMRTPRGVRATPSTVAEHRELQRSSRSIRIGDIAQPTHGRLPTEPTP